jgi:hypothetical protein
VQYCSSLVTLDRKDDRGDGTAEMVIQLAHFSVQEYLVSDPNQADMAGNLQETTARAAIVGVCLLSLLE